MYFELLKTLKIERFIANKSLAFTTWDCKKY
jgi:hypothetical protein